MSIKKYCNLKKCREGISHSGKGHSMLVFVQAYLNKHFLFSFFSLFVGKFELSMRAFVFANFLLLSLFVCSILVASFSAVIVIDCDL